MSLGGQDQRHRAGPNPDDGSSGSSTQWGDQPASLWPGLDGFAPALHWMLPLAGISAGRDAFSQGSRSIVASSGSFLAAFALVSRTRGDDPARARPETKAARRKRAQRGRLQPGAAPSEATTSSMHIGGGSSGSIGGSYSVSQSGSSGWSDELFEERCNMVRGWVTLGITASSLAIVAAEPRSLLFWLHPEQVGLSPVRAK